MHAFREQRPTRPAISSDRQHPYTVTAGVHGYESAALERQSRGLDCADDDIANRGRQNILGAELMTLGRLVKISESAAPG
jgi:hypothetical protein